MGSSVWCESNWFCRLVVISLMVGRVMGLLVWLCNVVVNMYWLEVLFF